MTDDPDLPLDVADQIAHVFVDIISLASDEALNDDGDSLIGVINAAQARAFELGAIRIDVSEEGRIQIDPNLLMAGAASALGALFRVARAQGGADDDAILALWRSEIDD